MDLTKYWDLIYNWGKDKIVMLLIIVLAITLLYKNTSSFVIVKPSGKQKIKIEVYDMCLDTLSKEDSCAIADFLADVDYTPKKIKNVAIHCTATKEGVNPTTKWWIDYFYKEKYPGAYMVGYNYLVAQDRVIALRPINKNNVLEKGEVVWGVAGFNSQTVSIAYVGGLDKNLKNKDTRNQYQKDKIDSLVKEIVKIVPDVKVQGHRDFPKVIKSCPNFSVIK